MCWTTKFYKFVFKKVLLKLKWCKIYHPTKKEDKKHHSSKKYEYITTLPLNTFPYVILHFGGPSKNWPPKISQRTRVILIGYEKRKMRWTFFIHINKSIKISLCHAISVMSNRNHFVTEFITSSTISLYT